MVLIQVPKPPKSAMNPNRRVSTLLKNQIQHLQEAEFRLPVKQQTNVYINTIKTEGEAADYIRRVTEALHQAHGIEPKGAAATPIAVVTKRRAVPGRDIAAVADIRPRRKSKAQTKAKSKSRPSRKK